MGPSYKCDTIFWTAYYNIQYIIYFIIIGVILAISTCLTLNKMRRSFGPESYEDTKLIKFTLIIFSASYVLRVTESIMLVVFKDYAEEISPSVHHGLKLAGWVLWDLLPILCLFIIHFNNFNSYKNEDILYCEYSEDGRSSMNSYADYLFQDITENNKEDSIFK